MIRVGFLMNGEVGWEQRIAANCLLEHLSGVRFITSIAFTTAPPKSESISCCGSARRIPKFPGRSVLSALAGSVGIGSWIRGDQLQIIHTWCVSSAFATLAAIGGTRARIGHVILELFDAKLTWGQRRLLRTLSQGGSLTVVCASQFVRRRLIEHGIRPDRTVVIRPSVDFGLINQTRRGGLRERLGLNGNDLAVLLPPNLDFADHYFDAYIAGSISHYLLGSVRVMVPHGVAGRERIVRFSETVPRSGSLILPGIDVPVERLISVADVLLVPAAGDCSTTAVAWAMAAGKLVVGVASYALAELIAHKVNGLLFKHTMGARMTAPIAGLLREIGQNRATYVKFQEAARGQAYEVFSSRRYVDQFARLYENVLSGKEPADGIADPAMVA